MKENNLNSLRAVQPRPENFVRRGDERKYIFALKKIVWEFEKTNYNFVVFYHREKQWWHTGGHSMLVLYYHLKNQLELRRLTIRHDNDYGDCKWREGYIATGDITIMKKRFQNAGFKVPLETSEVIAFRLPKPVSEDEMTVFSNAEENKIARFNSLVVPKLVYPEILSKTAILHREIVNKAVNLNEPRRKYYGDQGVELSSWIALNAISMANERIPVIDFFDEAIKKCGLLNDWLAYTKKFDMFDIDTDIRIAQGIIELRDLLCKERHLIEAREKREKSKQPNIIEEKKTEKENDSICSQMRP